MANLDEAETEDYLTGCVRMYLRFLTEYTANKKELETMEQLCDGSDCLGAVLILNGYRELSLKVAKGKKNPAKDKMLAWVKKYKEIKAKFETLNIYKSMIEFTDAFGSGLDKMEPPFYSIETAFVHALRTDKMPAVWNFFIFLFQNKKKWKNKQTKKYKNKIK